MTASEINDVDDLRGMLDTEILAVIQAAEQRAQAAEAREAMLQARLAALTLDRSATRSVLARYVHAVVMTRYPKMDGSEWQGVRELADAGSIVKQVAHERDRLRAAKGGER